MTSRDDDAPQNCGGEHDATVPPEHLDDESSKYEIALLESILARIEAEGYKPFHAHVDEPMSLNDADEFEKTILALGDTHEAPSFGVPELASTPRLVGTPDLLAVVSAAGEETRNGVTRLHQLSESDDQTVARAANKELDEARDELRPALRPASEVPYRLFQLGSHYDQLLGKALSRAHARKTRRKMENAWTLIGILISMLVVTSLLSSHWVVAGALLIVRQACSARWGAEASLPFECREWTENPSGGDEELTPEHGPSVMYRCLAGHFCDSLMLFGLTVSLVHHGWLAGSLLSLVALLAMLFGTILRIAAIQAGIRIYRLNLERILRVWPVSIACISTIFLPASLMLGLAPFGALIYGVGELVRSSIRIHHEFKQAPDRIVRFSTLSKTGTGAMVALSREERRFAPA